MNKEKLAAATNFLIKHFQENPKMKTLIKEYIEMDGDMWDDPQFNPDGCLKGITFRNLLRVNGYGEDACGIPDWQKAIGDGQESYFFRIMWHVICK
jgi:hypothetical protein